MRPVSLLVCGLLLVWLAGLGGCSGKVAVAVDNRSGRSVEVRLVREKLAGPDPIILQRVVRGEAYEELGRYRAGVFDPLEIWVREANDQFGLFRKIEVSTRRATFLIDEAGPGRWERIEVTPLGAERPLD